ncbi:flagellin N-terminal helical domain-containing protein [Lutispora saccharofermentans]|nr:flagellin [Lutispora saccharofermentans]
MRINTNIQAINAYRQLTVSHGKVSKNIEKLSSGLRINRAGDDAAGLAISEKMRSQIRGLKMAERNTLDGVSLIQTAEGALQEVHNALQRMRELSIQAANGTMESHDRLAIQNEIDQLTYDIDRIAKTTQFNANPLLRGSLLSRSVITTNSPDIKYVGSGTWKGDVAAEPSARGEVELQLGGLPADGQYIMINGKYYEFEDTTANNGVSAGRIKVDIGASSGATLNNLLDAIAENDKTFDKAASTVTGSSLLLKTAKNMSPSEARKIEVDSSGTTSADFKDSLNPAKPSVTKLNAPDTSTNWKTTYLNFTELPKTGDMLVIDGVTIEFKDESVPYDNSTNTAVVGVKDRTVYDVMAEVYNAITSAKNNSKAEALIDFKVNGNSLILTTNKTDDGAGNGLEIEYRDNDFETYAGKDMDINLQIGANDSESMKLLIGVVDAAFLGIGRKADHKGVISTAGVDAEAGISIMSEEDANNAIGFFDNAIRMVSESRSRLGAYQNRLEHTVSNITTTAENLTAAESRIRDVDMALEMSEFTKNSIINQAATAMLAQANQMPQGVLKLLQ